MPEYSHIYCFATIRSTLRPRLIQTTTSITNSKKTSNTKTTRRTRNSRRIAQKRHPEETLNGRNVSEELLHMIDTMPFQPVSKGGEYTSVSYTCISFNFYIVCEGKVTKKNWFEKYQTQKILDTVVTHRFTMRHSCVEGRE